MADLRVLGEASFSRLARGAGLGKSSILIYDSCVSHEQPSEVDMLVVQGEDADACQLVVTLHPPRVIPIAHRELSLDYQNSTGEQTNAEVVVNEFPGSCEPIKWPPLEAVIEFGVGGVNTKVVVDYLNGATIPVTASYLRVRAIVTQSDKCNGIFGTSAAYFLAAHVGPGYCSPRAQRTIYVGTICSDDESEVFPIPRFAKSAMILGCGHACDEECSDKAPKRAEGFIRYWQSPDGSHCVGDAFFSDPHKRVEIPNAAQYFSVFNDSGHKMKIAVIFDLAL